MVEVAATGIATGSLLFADSTVVVTLAFCTVVGQSPESRTNGQNRPLPQDAVVTAGVGCGTGVAGGALAATGVGCVLTGTGTDAGVALAFSAADAQSPESRTNGQNRPLPQDAVVTAGVGCGTGVAGGVLAATGVGCVLAGAGTDAVVALAFSAADAQSPESRTNGQNRPLPQDAVMMAGVGCGTGVAGGALAATGGGCVVAGAGTDAGVALAFSAADAQSPELRTNGQNRPLPQDAVMMAGVGCGTGVAGGALAATGVGCVLAGAGTDAGVALAFSAADAQSPESRTNGQNRPLPQFAELVTAGAAVTCATGAGDGVLAAAGAGWGVATVVVAGLASSGAVAEPPEVDPVVTGVCTAGLQSSLPNGQYQLRPQSALFAAGWLARGVGGGFMLLTLAGPVAGPV